LNLHAVMRVETITGLRQVVIKTRHSICKIQLTKILHCLYTLNNPMQHGSVSIQIASPYYTSIFTSRVLIMAYRSILCKVSINIQTIFFGRCIFCYFKSRFFSF